MNSVRITLPVFLGLTVIFLPGTLFSQTKEELFSLDIGYRSSTGPVPPEVISNYWIHTLKTERQMILAGERGDPAEFAGLLGKLDDALRPILDLEQSLESLDPASPQYADLQKRFF